MNLSCNYKISPDRNLSARYNVQQGQKGVKNLTKPFNVFINSEIKNDEFITKNISFKSGINEYFELKKLAEPILARSIVFGPNEYRNLSKADLDILRKFGENYKDSGITRFLLDFGEFFSKQIHKKYPDGFVFVSVGRSPAFLGKFLEFQGEDVKYCPISGKLESYRSNISPSFAKKYKKYLDTIGLTEEFVKNSPKPIIITDFCNTGQTLYRFEKFLELPEIGIKGEKLIYSPITDNGFWENKNSIFNCCWTDLHYENVDYDISEYYGSIMPFMLHKEKFTSIPQLYVWFDDNEADEIFGKFYSNGNKFEENFDTKMINFLTAEKVLSKE